MYGRQTCPLSRPLRVLLHFIELFSLLECLFDFQTMSLNRVERSSRSQTLLSALNIALKHQLDRQKHLRHSCVRNVWTLT